MKTLIKFTANWADEFDCEQFQLVDQSLNQTHLQLMELLDDGYLGFGTNQGWEKGEITINNFEISEISDVRWDMLHDLFSKDRFGTGIL